MFWHGCPSLQTLTTLNWFMIKHTEQKGENKAIYKCFPFERMCDGKNFWMFFFQCKTKCHKCVQRLNVQDIATHDFFLSSIVYLFLCLEDTETTEERTFEKVVVCLNLWASKKCILQSRKWCILIVHNGLGSSWQMCLMKQWCHEVSKLSGEFTKSSSSS